MTWLSSNLICRPQPEVKLITQEGPCAFELALLVVATAHHREDCAVRRQRNQRDLGHALVLPFGPNGAELALFLHYLFYPR